MIVDTKDYLTLMTSFQRDRNLKMLLDVSIFKNNINSMKPLIDHGLSADESRLKFINYMIPLLK